MSVDISGKGLTAVDASKFDGKTETIDLNGNALTTLSPGTFDKCTALTQLDLYGNKIKDIPAGVIGGLKELKNLNCFNNVMKKLPADIGGLEKLEEVNFSGNKMMMTTDPLFLGWGSVQVLNLYDNNLVRMGSLAPCVSLTELRLYGNNLEDMPVISDVPGLTIFEIHKNRIAKVADDYFKKTPALERLSIWGNMLTALPSSLLECSALAGLQAQENPIESLPSGEWPTSLETLFVQETKLTTLPASLTACKLKRVNVAGIGSDSETAALEAKMRAIVLAEEGGIFWSSKNEKLEQSKGHK